MLNRRFGRDPAGVLQTHIHRRRFDDGMTASFDPKNCPITPNVCRMSRTLPFGNCARLSRPLFDRGGAAWPEIMTVQVGNIFQSNLISCSRP